MARFTAREAAMQLLYARLMGGDGGDETLANLIACPLEQDDLAYIRDVTAGVSASASELDARIGQNAREWPVARMARVDLTIMRLALYEMLHREDVPSAVAINEAVELSRRFSTPEAGAFINGILGSVGRELEQQK